MKTPALFSQEWFAQAIESNEQHVLQLQGARSVLMQMRDLAFPPEKEAEEEKGDGGTTQ